MTGGLGSTPAGDSTVTARDEVLARIRAAIGEAPPEPKPTISGYRTTSELAPAELIDLLADRLNDYGAAVRRCTPDELGAVVGAALAERGAHRVLRPTGLDVPLPYGLEVVADDGLSAADLDACDGVVTTATRPSPRPGRSCSTDHRGRAVARYRSCPTTTCAFCAPTRSWRWCPRQSPPWIRRHPSPGSAGRRRPATSSLTGCRACTDRARSRSSWSAPARVLTPAREVSNPQKVKRPVFRCRLAGSPGPT